MKRVVLVVMTLMLCCHAPSFTVYAGCGGGGGGGGKKSSKDYTGTFKKEKVGKTYVITLEVPAKKAKVFKIDYSKMNRQSLKKLAKHIDKKCDVKVTAVKDKAGNALTDDKGRPIVKILYYKAAKAEK